MQSGLRGILPPVGVGGLRYRPPGRGARSRTGQAKHRDVIHVRDFGAVGLGGRDVDDTAAIQRAIAYAETLSNAPDSASVLDGVFTEIDCSGATWGLGSPLTFRSSKNIVMHGGRFKAVGTWAALTPMFDINGVSDIAISNLTFRDIQFDGNRKASGFNIEDAPRVRLDNIRGTHYLDYGFRFGPNTWGTCLIDPVLHEWDSDDANLEVGAQRLADGIRIDGGLDARVLGGFIGFNKRGIACLSGGYGFNFIGTHIYGTALVTPQDLDIVFAVAGTTGMQFDHCYFDSGWVHLLGAADHRIHNCRFFRNAAIAHANLTAYIHLEASAAAQGLLLRALGNYFEDSGGTSRPVFKLTESGGNTYVFNKGTFTTAGHDQWVVKGNLNLTSEGTEDTPLSLRSGNATKSLQAFAGLSTTVTPKAGADGNEYVIEQNGAERMRFLNSSARIPNNYSLVARNQANNGDVTIARLDTSNLLRVGSGAGLYVFEVQPVPTSNGAMDLGSSSLRFKDIYATNTTIQTSDVRLKKDIAPVPDGGLGLVMAIEPITFRWIEGDDTRLHWGFRAGDVKAALDAGMGIDCAAYLVDPETGLESLRPAEMIPILWKAVQELAGRCAALERSSGA